MIRGEKIYTQTLSAGNIVSANGRRWQYHSRSDAHSKAACWAIVLDLLENCALLRKHVEAGRVGFGINHVMHDFRLNRKKNLDLVICTHAEPGIDSDTTFLSLVESFGVVLDPTEKGALAKLPDFRRTSVGSVLVALEAKACMTEHIKACPRLYDELSSSFQTIHGDTQSAIAAAFVTINTAEEFVSPVRNKDVKIGKPLKTTIHGQPHAAKRVLEKTKELPRRSGEDGVGYDALGVVFIECRNDGSPVSTVEELSDGTKVDPIITYSAMIQRIASQYTSRYREL